MDPTTRPTCWSCGYELSGMRVDDRCPECGVEIWSRPIGDAASIKRAKHALGWGIESLITFFLCIGPLAAFVAIPAVVMGGRVRRDVREGRVAREVVGGAGAGFWMGWIVIGLSIVTVTFYLLVFGVMISPVLFGGGQFPANGP